MLAFATDPSVLSAPTPSSGTSVLRTGASTCAPAQMQPSACPSGAENASEP